MSCRVRVLPPELADQIAAGEVVERPASVVKELAENALDAGATRITIEIEAGGRRLVRVTDDGSGMTPEEARLAIRRHATSKLTSIEELFRLSTLGFRGEALPSIAAVSRFLLTTRTREAIAGTQIEVVGGVERELREAGCPPGTQVEARDLLFNVPARLKFLKSEASEAAAASEAILRLALAHPAVHLTLRHGGRALVDLPPHADEAERLRVALSRRGKSPLFLAEGEDDGVRVRAHLGRPEESQPTARNVHFFVNGRFVRDRGLLQSLLLGYGELCERGRYADAVVFLDVPPAIVDVNVHPQKLEVRFADPKRVQGALRRTVREALSRAPWLALDLGSAAAPKEDPAKEEPASGMREAVQQYFAGGTVAWASPRATSLLWQRTGPSDLALPRPAMAATAELTKGPSARPAPDPLSREPIESFFSSLDYIGQLHCLYLVCQAEGELVLIDQHAAHERVAFERLRRSHAAKARSGQRLLFPVTLEPGAELMAVAEEAGELLAACGFEIEPFGALSLAVKAVPEPLAGCDPAPLVQDVLAEIAELGVVQTVGHQLEHLFATMACHSVTRAGDSLTRTEVLALLASMDGVDRRANCPHGRPVLLRLRLDELARRFERA